MGNCLNVFSGNCIVSPPRKNKEEQPNNRRNREEREGEDEASRGNREKEKEMVRNKGMDERAERAREPANCRPSSSERGAFRPGVPSLRTGLPRPSLPCPPVHLRRRRDRSWELWRPVFYLLLCHGTTTPNVVYFLWSLNKAANNRESQINVNCRRSEMYFARFSTNWRLVYTTPGVVSLPKLLLRTISSI